MGQISPMQMFPQGQVRHHLHGMTNNIPNTSPWLDRFHLCFVVFQTF